MPSPTNKDGARPSGGSNGADAFWSWPSDGKRHELPRPWAGLVHLLDRGMAPFWSQPLLFGALVVVAVWASWWGFTSFYGAQYGRVPAYVWPFVPDSPLSTISWVVAAAAIKWGWDRRGATGKAWAFFTNWAAMMNAKVGLWTAFAILYYHDHFFAGGPVGDAFQVMLIVSHLGMVVFATMLVRKQRRLPPVGYVAILGLALLWDFMDYFFADLFLRGQGVTIFPAGIPVDPARIGVLAWVTVGFSVLATLYVAVAMRLRGPPVED